jgi:hypothetical protein
VGGQTADDPQARLARTERFDPRSGTFRPGPQMSEPRYKISDAVVTLADGRVVIAGGYGIDTYADGALRALGTVPGPERQFPAAAALSLCGPNIRGITVDYLEKGAGWCLLWMLRNAYPDAAGLDG